MSHDRRSFAARFLYLYVGVVLLISFAACRQVPADKDITSVSTISGTVNDSAVEGKISATFNTGRGGSSTCEFSQLPLGFTPSAFGTHTWTSHHTSAGLSRIGSDVMNLYDLTGGNYSVLRTISFPEYPENQLVMEAEVTATHDTEWDTKLTINGTYNGPTDFVSQKDYRLKWSMEGEKLMESGSMTLETSSGQSVRCVWSSEIVTKGDVSRFPAGGEEVTVTISPFEVTQNSMSYKWEGSVQAQSE